MIATSRTAWIIFRIDPTTAQHIILHAGGDVENVRSALRGACRARRTIVLTRFFMYAANVVKHFLAKSIDIVEIVPAHPFTAIQSPHFRYELWIDERSVPMIAIESQDERFEPITEPLFQFLGVEGRRGVKRGRPSPHPNVQKSPVPDYIDPVTHEPVYLPKGALNPDEFKQLLKLRDHQAVRPLTYTEQQLYEQLQRKIGQPIPTQPVRMTKAERDRLEELNVKAMRGNSRGHRNALGEMEEFEYNQLLKKHRAWDEWKHPENYRDEHAPRKIRRIRK